MKESTLKEFFEGKVGDDELLSDLTGAALTSGDVAHFRIEDMDTEFTVTTSHLVKVCDSALSGKLQPEQLKSIGFCLQASDTFDWDADTEEGGRVADIVFYLSSPEINYDLNAINLSLFKELLLHGGNPLGKTT